MVGTGLVALPLGRPPEPPSAPQMMPEPGSSPTPAFSPPRGLGRNLAHYGDANLSVFLRKAFIKALGYTDDALSRPVIGLVNTASGFNACHHNVPELIDAASRGILLRGGIPIPFPVISLHEMFVHPTSMYLRNLMSMDVEEMIRAQPMDAVVLIGGCDKTVPALLMGAASVNVPAILLLTGPMLTGCWRGERVGACTDCRRFWARYRGGEVTDEEIADVNSQLAPTVGTCSVMGTASTMAVAAEALGITLPGGACIPAVFAERLRHAEAVGCRAVDLALEGLTPSEIITPMAVTNALRATLAAGGSTNAIIHLTAVAGRLGIGVDLDTVDALARETPVLIDLKPIGQHYMEDLHRAGGAVTLLRELRPMLDLSCRTVTGRTLGENLDASPTGWPQGIVHGLADPVHAEGGMAVLRGNLAPGGALMKHAAGTPALLQHTGPAVVFEGLADLTRRIDDPTLPVSPQSVLMLRGVGPKGAPGMPEAGYLPIPRKLARQGTKDMVRISDARMSGTAFGTVVLHVTPEAAVGGPLGLVRTGDLIRLDTANRRLDVLIDEAEWQSRRREKPPVQPPAPGIRGYERLFLEQVLQADQGCDFSFLTSPIRCWVGEVINAAHAPG